MSKGKSRHAKSRTRKLTPAMCQVSRKRTENGSHVSEPTHASEADIAAFRSVKVVAEAGRVTAEGTHPDAVLAAFEAMRGLSAK